jgi:hypothetical protein
VVEIGQKVRRLCVFSDVSRRWTHRGTVIGSLVANILAPVLAAVEIARCLSEPGGAGQLADALLGLAMFFLTMALFLPVLFGSVAFVMAATIRPIRVALFCSVERFEQEYGSSRK